MSTKRRQLQKENMSSTTRKQKVVYPSYFACEQNPDSLFVENNEIHQYPFIIPRKNNASLQNVTLKGVEDDTLQQPSLQEDEKREGSQQNLISTEQINNFNNIIFTNANLDDFSKIYLTYGSKEAHLWSIPFLINIILDYNLQYRAIKYDEDTNRFKVVTSNEIFNFLQKHFMKRTQLYRKKTTELQQLQRKEDNKANIAKTEKEKNVHSYISANDNDHPINSWMSFGLKFYNKPKDEDNWSKCVNQSDEMFVNVIKNDYDEDKYRNEHSHSLYSVIQPFFDEYELVVFNGSHRLSYSPNPNEHFCVHANTRVRLQIPSPTETDLNTFMILFNSRLVHCGTKSSRENPTSTNHRLNFRLFSYVIQSYYDTNVKIQKLTKKDPSESDNDVIITNTRKGTIDQTSFEVCNPLQCETCKTCPSRKGNIKEGRIADVIINIREEYFKRKRNPDQEYKDGHGIERPRTYLCGDLDKHGWEVHYGVDYMKNYDELKFLRMHLEHLHLHSGSKVWNTIVKSNGREYMKLENTLGISNLQTLSSMKFLQEVCAQKIHNIVVNIRGFTNSHLEGQNLLANRKRCTEQNYHRDFYPPNSWKSSSSEETREKEVSNTEEEKISRKRKATRERQSRRVRSSPKKFQP